jgi:hypothetical protein
VSIPDQNRSSPETGDDRSSANHKPLVQVTDLGDGTVHVRIEQTLAWEDALRLLNSLAEDCPWSTRYADEERGRA